MNRSEREYVLGVFAQYRSKGISKREIERAVRELKTTADDLISENQAGKIKKALLANL